MVKKSKIDVLNVTLKTELKKKTIKKTYYSF